MGRIASTLRPPAPSGQDGGLLLDPSTDLWADWGLLGVPDPDRASMTRQGLLFRDFIRSAFPTLSGDSENWSGGDTKTGPPCGANH